MKYIITFDVSALFIFLVLFSLHFRKKNLKVIQNKAYILFILDAFLATLFDIVTIELDTKIACPPEALAWILNLLAFFHTNTLPTLFFVYCTAVLNFYDECSEKQFKFLKNLITIPTLLVIVLVAITPIVYKLTNYPVLFYIDEFHKYHRGGICFYFLYIVLLFDFVAPFVILILRRRIVNKTKIITIVLYLVISLLTIALQMLFPRLLVQGFGIALASVMFAILIQTPEEYLDRTTNLFNKEALVKMSRYFFEKKEGFLIVSVILDDTLFITNAFGIKKMNEFLLMVANFLKANFPDAEIYYLPQGKFCMLIKNYHPREIEKFVFELRARFHEPWLNDSLELKLYSRICVIECPRDAKDAETINDIIDMVTEDSRFKRSVVYAKDIDTELTKRTAYIAHLLRNALTEKRFDVYYQPIYSVKEEGLIGAEALIRLKDEEGNFVSPEEFIPIAEKTGDILRIGQFVFDSVCKTLSSIDIEAYGIKKIDINLSVAQCMHEILAEQILTIRTIHNIPSSVINMEITETASAHTPEILLKNMKRLNDEGIELSLDDYGSGFSNMSYLLNLPFRMIKIDKNIVWSAFEDPKAKIALAATIDMIKKLDMTVLAEGIETVEQKNALEAMGCDYLQGFYFAKGLPKDEFLKMMAEQKATEIDSL